jgi:hypothetical protein
MELYPCAAKPSLTIASACALYKFSEMQLAGSSLQSMLHRKISQDIQPMGGVRANFDVAPTDAQARIAVIIITGVDTSETGVVVFFDERMREKQREGGRV